MTAKQAHEQTHGSEFHGHSKDISFQNYKQPYNSVDLRARPHQKPSGGYQASTGTQKSRDLPPKHAGLAPRNLKEPSQPLSSSTMDKHLFSANSSVQYQGQQRQVNNNDALKFEDSLTRAPNVQKADVSSDPSAHQYGTSDGQGGPQHVPQHNAANYKSSRNEQHLQTWRGSAQEQSASNDNSDRYTGQADSAYTGNSRNVQSPASLQCNLYSTKDSRMVHQNEPAPGTRDFRNMRSAGQAQGRVEEALGHQRPSAGVRSGDTEPIVEFRSFQS